MALKGEKNRGQGRGGFTARGKRALFGVPRYQLAKSPCGERISPPAQAPPPIIIISEKKKIQPPNLSQIFGEGVATQDDEKTSQPAFQSTPGGLEEGGTFKSFFVGFACFFFPWGSIFYIAGGMYYMCFFFWVRVGEFSG